MEIKELFLQIEVYHRKLGYFDRQEIDPAKRMDRLRDNVLAVHAELTELLDSFPWKPWRAIKSQSWDMDNAKREIVDILFFLVAICEIAHIEWFEIEYKFWEILRQNYDRIDNGYSNTVEERR